MVFNPYRMFDQSNTKCKCGRYMTYREFADGYTTEACWECADKLLVLKDNLLDRDCVLLDGACNCIRHPGENAPYTECKYNTKGKADDAFRNTREPR